MIKGYQRKTGRRGWSNSNRNKMWWYTVQSHVLIKPFTTVGTSIPLAFATGEDEEREEPHLNSQ